MKNALDWIKSNPFTVGCIVVAVAGFAVFGYFYAVAAPAFSKEKSDAIAQQKQKQQVLINVPVPLPNEDPNAPPVDYSVVVNDVVIRDVQGIYATIKNQYESILRETAEKNSQRHQSVLLGGSDLWPDADQTQFALYVQAAVDYKAHFKAVFDYANANPWNMPRMVASSPPSEAELNTLLELSAFNFINSIGAGEATKLNQTQAEQLFAEQRVKLMKALTDRARSIHLYAQLPTEEDPFAVQPEDGSDTGATGITDSPLTGGVTDLLAGAGAEGKEVITGYPFTIAPWAQSNAPPKPDELWEGQIELWIIRDVMQAIHDLNNVGKAIDVLKPDGSVLKEPASVINSPVKRLLQLQPLPGYVGLHTVGGVITEGGSLSPTFSGGGGLGSEPIPGVAAPAPIPGAPEPALTSTIYPDPPIELSPKDPTAENAPEHFGISPTGRVSNSVFDVRHTRLVIDIELDKLPAFMEQLRQTNFMSIIKLSVEELDEYELLRNGGYVYGSADVVRADMIVESLWYREWTAQYMPKVLRQKLLIEPSAQQALDAVTY